MTSGDRQRVDKWLWFARVTRTRTAAQALAVSGQVRVNREKIASASRAVGVGDVLTIVAGPRIRVLKVAAIGLRRGPSTEAQTLFEDLSPPPAAPEIQPVRGGARPTTRDRRAIDSFRGRQTAGEDDPGEPE